MIPVTSCMFQRIMAMTSYMHAFYFHRHFCHDIHYESRISKITTMAYIPHVLYIHIDNPGQNQLEQIENTNFPLPPLQCCASCGQFANIEMGERGLIHIVYDLICPHISFQYNVLCIHIDSMGYQVRCIFYELIGDVPLNTMQVCITYSVYLGNTGTYA